MDASAEPAGAQENFAIAAERSRLTVLPFLAWDAFRRQADSPLPQGVSNLRKRFAVVPSLQAAFHARAVELIDSACSPHVEVHGWLDGHCELGGQMGAKGDQSRCAENEGTWARRLPF